MTTALSPQAVRDVLAAGARAPSGHNTQPWILRADGPDGFEVRGDPDRTLPVTDPDHRALRLACGAALAGMRLALRARELRTHVRLLPDPEDPWSFARLRAGSPLPCSPAERALAAAIGHRHSHRRAFGEGEVRPGLRAELRRAAEAERSWLYWIETPVERDAVAGLVAEAAHAQDADPAWRAEQEAWTGRGEGALDGVPAAGPRPPRDDPWRVRDLTGGAGDPDRPDRHAAIGVLATAHDLPLAHLQAGQALQRVLLTATVHGLGASFVAPPVEVPSTRAALRVLLGGALWPQAVLRLGPKAGDDVPSPRRPV
ncbi:Acg family FMN-binding oxidoreductase [Actinomycetospora rhizophila]|uniref:Acg family FMN-binding oxidoreductase n=1 Tax=Actinomycetospora rhizophila TaxID=1416876 RepID=A0ABV9Z9R9_9PSEU